MSLTDDESASDVRSLHPRNLSPGIAIFEYPLFATNDELDQHRLRQPPSVERLSLNPPGIQLIVVPPRRRMNAHGLAPQVAKQNSQQLPNSQEMRQHVSFVYF